MMKTLWDEADSVMHWWKQRPAVFNQYLAETREEVIREIKDTTDLVVLGRCQGRLLEIDRQLKLEGELHGILVKKK